jgi:ArsR family transcriptional regulator
MGIPVAEVLPPAQCCTPLAAASISDQDAAITAAVFKALSDPTRIRIVNLLANSSRPVCLCDINDHFELSQPTMTHHLKKLVAVGLLERKQQGTWAYYSVDREALRRLAEVFRTTAGAGRE